jgi:hypothetical protein
MKIRTDFVTNSSSVSFIITMDLYISENYNLLERETDTTKKKIIYGAVKEDLINNGVSSCVDGHETYVKKYRIRPKTDATFEKMITNAESIDFSALGDEELWKYINGEYILGNRITSEYQGFSSFRVPKECPDVRSFMVITSPCNVKMDKRKLHFSTDERKKKVFDTIVDDLLSTGEEIKIDGKKVVIKDFTFDIKKDCKYEAHIPPEETFAEKSKEEIMPYILGEYLLNRRMKEFECMACLPVGVKPEKKPASLEEGPLQAELKEQ